MDERIPKQPDKNWQNYLQNFNNNSYIKINLAVLNGNKVRFTVNKIKKIFTFLKKDMVLEIDGSKEEEIIEWIKSWEKEIKNYEKGRNLIESLNLTTYDLIETRRIELKERGLLLEVREYDGNIEAKLTNLDKSCGYIYVFNNEKEMIDYMDRILDDLRKKQKEVDNSKKLTNFEKLLKEIEDKFNKKYKGEQIKIESCGDGRIIVHIKTQNKGWEATSTTEYENFDKFAKWIRSLKIM